MKSLTGKTIGRYRIMGNLGKGGMAQVYKAQDAKLKNYVALKILAPSFGISDEFHSRFKREAKVLTKLSHPNIVKILNSGEFQGMLYLVMEYVEGGTLKDKLGSPMPVEAAAEMLLPVAEALQYAHDMSIAHLDVKPANILITRDGQLKLADFGVAKILDMDDTLDLSGPGIGTPEYMSPETGLEKLDSRSDIYSLGIIFYEMIAGRTPFKANTPLAVILQKTNKPLPPPSKYAKGIPDSVEKIILTALAKNPANRFASMSAFAKALQGIGKHESFSFGVGRKRLKVAAYSVAAAAVLILGFTFSSWSSMLPGLSAVRSVELATVTHRAMSPSPAATAPGSGGGNVTVSHQFPASVDKDFALFADLANPQQPLFFEGHSGYWRYDVTSLTTDQPLAVTFSLGDFGDPLFEESYGLVLSNGESGTDEISIVLVFQSGSWRFFYSVANQLITLDTYISRSPLDDLELRLNANGTQALVLVEGDEVVFNLPKPFFATQRNVNLLIQTAPTASLEIDNMQIYLLTTSEAGNQGNSEGSSGQPVYLADLTPQGTPSVGWGRFSAKTFGVASVGENILFGEVIHSHGLTFPYGLAAHASSLVSYKLEDEFQRLTATLTVYSENNLPCGGDGVIFKVYVDSVEVYESPVLFPSSQPLEVDIALVQGEVLKLVTEPRNNIDCDFSIWGDPALHLDAPNPDAASVSSEPELILYSDFENDSDHVNNLFTLTDPRSISHFEATVLDGVLNLSPKNAGQGFDMELMLEDSWGANDAYVFQADMNIPANSTGEGGIQMNLGVDGPEHNFRGRCDLYTASQSLVFVCQYVSQDGEWIPLEYTTFIPVETDTWYTVKIVFDKAENRFEFFLDDAFAGQIEAQFPAENDVDVWATVSYGGIGGIFSQVDNIYLSENQ